MNEWEEFSAYTVMPDYKADSKSDTTFMGRFTLQMLLDLQGFHRILTILARGYLFRDGANGYDRVELTRRALLSWCSVRMPETKKTPDQDDPRLRVNFGEYAEEFPELVRPDGDGWLIRHVDNIVAFVNANPGVVRKNVFDKADILKKGFRRQWVKKLRQMQVPLFALNTKGAWVLRFDGILADALELGPLRDDSGKELPEEMRQWLTERTPPEVPITASLLLYRYYEAHKIADGAYVVLPNQAFNAWFGNIGFSHKWTAALSKEIIEKKYSEGVTKYRMREVCS